MTLPFDIARCAGTTAPLCQQCRRREPGDKYQWHVGAEIVGSSCRNYIPLLPVTTSGGTVIAHD
jgi:hypothetical protein